MRLGLWLRLWVFSLCGWSAGAAAWPTLHFTSVYKGITRPTFIGNAGDGSGRLFLTEQTGRVRVVRNGALLDRPFLDITGRVSCCGERGLLSVAFPPGYNTKNYFYVYYTALNGDVTLSRFNTTANPDAADPASETVLLRIPHPVGNHNGGQLVFGPDGYLYMGVGDGGGEGDPNGNGQNTGVLLGKLLRLDVESGAQPYRIPPDNPLVGNAAAKPEIWAYGLRNPWRYSFDRQTHDLYIADVGQDRWEEIDFQRAGDKGGENYGWNVTEGNHCYSANCTLSTFTGPVAEYGHDQGCSVTGGYVYRGQRYATLSGIYFYADYCSGKVWGLQQVNGQWQNQVLATPGYNVTTFGEDESGEVYLADAGTGTIYMLAAGPDVVNAASGVQGVSPGSLAIARGSGWGVVAGSVDGVSVTVGGIPAPVLATMSDGGQDRIVLQVPYGLSGDSADVVITVNGTTAPAITVPVVPVQPALFTRDGSHATAQHPGSYRVVTADEPATAGEIVLLYGTGLGPVDVPPQTGQQAPFTPLARVTGAVGVTVGGSDAEVSYAGLAPQLIGVYQVNARVPDGVAAGDADVVLRVGAAGSPAVKLPVR